MTWTWVLQSITHRQGNYFKQPLEFSASLYLQSVENKFCNMYMLSIKDVAQMSIKCPFKSVFARKKHRMFLIFGYIRLHKWKNNTEFVTYLCMSTMKCKRKKTGLHFNKVQFTHALIRQIVLYLHRLWIEFSA